MTRREIKLRARGLMQTTRPHPCLVTLVLLVLTWLINYLAQRIGGQPLLIDLDAVEALDIQNMVRIEPSNMEFIPTTLLLIFQLVVIILSYGYNTYLLHAVRGEPSGYGNLLDGFGIAWRAVVLTLLVDALVTVASVALIIPGIVLAYAYSMASFLQIDHPDWSPIRCMRESRIMMRGHKWDLFVLQLSFIGWNLIATIPFFAVFVKPYVSLSETIFYEQLCAAKAQPPFDF